MHNPTIPSIEEKVYFATLTPEPRPEFADTLWRQIAGQPHRRTRLSSFFARPAWALVLVVLLIALGVALVGPQKVAAAFRSLLGYVPNVGFVEDTGDLRLAAGPVQVERGGITVIVENGAADSQGVRLNLRVEGLPDSTDRAGGIAEQPLLRLPGGETLSLLSGQTRGGDPMLAQYFFAPAPAGLTEAILVLPIPDGVDPQDWEITIPFRAAGEGEVVPAGLLEAQESEANHGITLVIDEIAQQAESTLLRVRLETGDPHLQPNSDWWTQLSLTGQDGKIYPLTDVLALDPEDNTSVRTLRTAGFSGDERLSLRLDQLTLAAWSPPDDATPGFRFDPGRNPVPGQTWELDQVLNANGIRLHVTRAELLSTGLGTSQLRFTVETPQDVSSVILTCDPQDSCLGSTTEPGNGSGSIRANLSFAGIPDRPLQIRLGTLVSSVYGPWQVDWQPLAPPTDGMSRPTATALPPERLTPTPVYQQPLAQELSGLVQKGFERLYGQPGWVHVITEAVLPPDSGFLLGPGDTIGEYWQYVEADGALSQYALIVKDPQGGVWQKIARVGNRQVNFLAQTATQDDSLLDLARPDSLPADVEAMQQQGGQVEKEEAVLDGKPCWLITLVDTFDPPLQVGGTDVTVSSVEQKVWVDRESGDILLRERFDHLADGTSITREHLHTLLQERVDSPPQEILDLLDQVGK